MARVLLLNTPFYRLMGSHYNGMSLGVSYVTAVLNANGHEAKIYNADYLGSDDYLNLREIFEGFGSYKQIMDNPDHPIWNEVVEKVLDFNPKYLGFSIYTANIKSSRLIAERVKKHNKNITIVIGGDHPTLNRNALEYPEFDFLIHREGEYTFLQLVNGTPPENILGLSYKNNGKVIHNSEGPLIEDLDALPFPDRHSYLNSTEHMDLGYVITGRGCPFACTYCASPEKWTRQATRFRSPENIVAELKYLKKILGTSKTLPDFSSLSANTAPKNDLKQTENCQVFFVDDTFTLYKKRTKALLNLMIESNLNITWKCDTRADCIDEELGLLMKKAGCVRAKIGAETGSDRLLKMLKKGEKREDIVRGITILQSADIPVTVYLMAGFPSETNEDLRQTIDLAYELDADYYSLSILSPYLGTEIFNDVFNNDDGHNHGEKNWEYFYHQSGEMILNNNLDPKIVEEFLMLNERHAKAQI